MQPPTDNLYKFLAIFGLSLIGLSVYTFLQRLEAVGRASIQVNAAYAGSVDQQRIQANAAQARLACVIGEMSKKEAGTATNPHQCDETLETIRAAAAANAQLAGAQAKAMALDLERTYYFVYIPLAVLLALGGIGCSYFGFWAWYHRLQKYQDEAVRNKTVAPAVKVADDIG